MGITIVDTISDLPAVGVVEDDEVVVKENNALYRYFDLSTITSYSWDFDNTDMVDTGSVFSFLSPGSKDSFSIEFFAARKTPDDVTVFNARVPREDSIFDLSSESNSINIYGLTEAVRYGPYTSNYTSIHLESSFDFITADSSIDSLSLFSPFTIEFWYNKYNTSTKDNIFSISNKVGVDVLTLNEDGVIVNGILHSASNKYDKNTWSHGALTYDGFNYALWKNGDSIELTRPTIDADGILLSHDSGFMNIFSMDRKKSSSWSVRTTISPTDKTLFFMGSYANRVELKTINSGADFKLSAGDKNGPSMIVSAPQDGEVHTISWDVKINPGRVRLWIDNIYQGSNSISQPLPAMQWAITDIESYDSISFTRSPSMIDSSLWSRTDGAQFFAKDVITKPTFSNESDGTYDYRYNYPIVVDETTGGAYAADGYYKWYYDHSIRLQNTKRKWSAHLGANNLQSYATDRTISYWNTGTGSWLRDSRHLTEGADNSGYYRTNPIPSGYTANYLADDGQTYMSRATNPSGGQGGTIPLYPELHELWVELGGKPSAVIGSLPSENKAPEGGAGLGYPGSINSIEDYTSNGRKPWTHQSVGYIYRRPARNYSRGDIWTKRGSTYVSVDNISVNRDGDKTYYFEIDRSKNPSSPAAVAWKNGGRTPDGIDTRGGRDYISTWQLGSSLQIYLTMVETSKVGVAPYFYHAEREVYQGVRGYYGRNSGDVRGHIGTGHSTVSGDGHRVANDPWVSTFEASAGTDFATGPAGVSFDQSHFLNGYFPLANLDKYDISYIVSEPDNRVYYFADTRYVGYIDFPSNPGPYTLILHKGHNNYYDRQLQHGDLRVRPRLMKEIWNGQSYGSYYAWYHDYYTRRYPQYSSQIAITQHLNQFKKFRVAPNSWTYDPVALSGLIPAADRSATLSTGDGAFGMDSLGDSWEGSLKTNLLYNTNLYNDYKDCNITIGEAVKNNRGEITGAQYAAEYVAKTGGSIINYSGSSGDDISTTVANLSEGDALVLPSGFYNINGITGTNDPQYVQSIWSGKGFLICGETSNPNDVELTARGVSRIFNGDTTINSQLAFLHFIKTGSSWYYYGDIIQGDAQGKAFKCIFNFNGGNQGWKYRGTGFSNKVIFDECIFINYSVWRGPHYGIGHTASRAGRVDMIEVTNCIFQKTFGPAPDPSSPTETPKFFGTNKQNQSTINTKFTRGNGMSEWYISDYTPGSKKRYIKDFMIHDSNKYPMYSVFNVDSVPITNDSNTNFSLGLNIKDTIFSYNTSGAIKYGMNKDSIHNIPNSIGDWVYTSLNYSGDSNILRTYVDGMKVDSSVVNLNINDLKVSNLIFNEIDSYNPATSVYDLSRGSFFLKEFRLINGQRRSDSFQVDIATQIANGQDQTQDSNDIFMTKHDGTHPLDDETSPYTADVKAFRKIAIFPNAVDSAYLLDIDGEMMLELDHEDGYRPVREIGPKYESDGSGGIKTPEIQESDGSYNGNITGLYHTQINHPDSSLAFSRPSFLINLKDSDDNGDSINWSYSIEHFNNPILQIGHDSYNKTFYLKAYDITESNMNKSSSLRFIGKSIDSINNRPLVGSLDRPKDSSATDIHINFNYDGNLGLDISYVGDKQFVRYITIDSINPTFDSTGFIFDPLPSLIGGII